MYSFTQPNFNGACLEKEKQILSVPILKELTVEWAVPS
jgi:hypothetical protein